jgi:hypothetical protein
VRQDVAHRLQVLFRDRRTSGCSTAFVLSRFKDLGDQYAPLFRELLHQVASMDKKTGLWTKKLIV